MKNVLKILITLLIIVNSTMNTCAIGTLESNVGFNEKLDLDINDNNESMDELNSNDKKISKIIDNHVNEPKIMYQTHVQDYGWNDYIAEGVSGTVGKSKRIESLKIKIDTGDYNGSVQYVSNIEGQGWSQYVSDGQISGTVGKSKRIEAIKIKLSGDIAEIYNVYYRVHIQDKGWLDWASNGSAAGSEGLNKRIEGIEIKLIKKEDSAPSNTLNPYLYPGSVYYSTHVEDFGWMNNVGDGKLSGTVGQAKRIEAFKLSLCNVPYDGSIEYASHVQDVGWQSYKKDGEISGTVGQAKRVEAIKIRLVGEIKEYYDIYYRVHVKDIGWLSWTCNDTKAGTEGFSLRIEAIEICLIEKGSEFTYDTSTPYFEQGNIVYNSHIQNIGWSNNVSNGMTSGTVGQGLRLESIKINLGNNRYSGNIEYSSHVQDYGWMNYVKDGEVSGTVGESKRIEAIKIRLIGEISNYYDVFYRVQCQELGWLDWTANDKIAGTTGGSYRIESIQIKLFPKLMSNPGISNKSYISFEDNNGFMVCKDANGLLYEDAQDLLGLRSSYVLRVNKSTNVVTVLVANGENVYNIAYKRFICSTGDETPFGTFYIPEKYRWRYLVGPSYGQYSTRIVGRILFHSLPYDKQNPYTLQTDEYNKLGTTCSHGCVRLRCIDAKWIYDYCNLGTRVDIVSGVDPLSKPHVDKIPSNQRWDPTDPNV